MLCFGKKGLEFDLQYVENVAKAFSNEDIRFNRRMVNMGNQVNIIIKGNLRVAFMFKVEKQQAVDKETGINSSVNGQIFIHGSVCQVTAKRRMKIWNRHAV